MSGTDPEDERLPHDGPVGAAPDPLPEPWFIREARDRRTRAQSSPAPVAAAAPPELRETAAAIPPPGRGPWRKIMLVALAATAVIILLLVAMPKTGGAPDSAPLDDGMTPASAAPAALDCASPATIARLRAIIVGQARAGGGDPEARAAGLSVSVAAEPDPLGSDGRTLACRGTLSLFQPDDDAPVTAQVAYRIRPAANLMVDVVDVRGAASIVAALGRPGLTPPLQAEDGPLDPEPPAPPAAAIPEPAPEVRSAGPSFDCRRITSRVLEAVCANPGLAVLDDEMSGLFYELRDGADRATSAALDETRDVFIARRQSCRDEDCIERVYRERIAELEDFR